MWTEAGGGEDEVRERLGRVRSRLDELAERRLLGGVTAAERAEYERLCQSERFMLEGLLGRPATESA